MTIYKHKPHPQIELRKKHAPKPEAPQESGVARFNSFLLVTQNGSHRKRPITLL